LAVLSIQAQDLAMLMGVVVFATIAILFFNLIVDLMYAWIDPRIRLS
jgi:peptide/nickel transport system permease protein